MKANLAVLALILLFRAPASAHRLDEYLQATILSVEPNRVAASLRLVPGVAVSSAVLASIDTDSDGFISEAEQHAYGERVLRDLSLSLNGRMLTLHLLKVEFPKLEELQEGLGEIKLEFAADSTTRDPYRKLVFENHHRPQRSVYLVNCLVPRDRDIQVLAQSRNQNQSFYQLHFVQAGSQSDTFDGPWWSNLLASIGDGGSFQSTFRLGMRHIAEGTDHLLFLLALLLPAPLLVGHRRWSHYADVRHSVQQIVRVVTAFTIGHSITLALAAFGWVRVPGRPIEILIAVSIFISAAHALRPLFPGREALIAAGFGLTHGLAFAATMQGLGLQWSDRLRSILAFNLGIEAMQLIVVSAAMPSLILLSRTRTYPAVRTGGALFAMLAAVGWFTERALNLHNFMNPLVEAAARSAAWIGAILLLISLLSWIFHSLVDKRTPSGDDRIMQQAN